jgi:DNA-binding NarL/FixJ family response regulator
MKSGSTIALVNNRGLGQSGSISQPRRKAAPLSMKILIADDHTLFREGLRYLLAQLDAGATVFEAGNHDAAAALLSQHPDTDLALIDLHMPGRNGPGALEALIRGASTVPIVVLSAEMDRREVRRALDAGAMGYIPKNESAQVMLGALRLVLSGGVYLPTVLLRTEDTSRPCATKVVMTTRQLDVLRELAQGKSNEAIGEELGLALSTVKAHISALLNILGAENRTHAVLSAKHLGLLGE